jgi:hypothetical protein
MTVGELRAELARWPQNAVVHLDVTASDKAQPRKQRHPWEEEDLDIIGELGGWEGDRVVRGVEGLRHQQGYFAVAIDAQSLEDTENQEDNFLIWDKDIKPTEG